MKLTIRSTMVEGQPIVVLIAGSRAQPVHVTRRKHGVAAVMDRRGPRSANRGRGGPTDIDAARAASTEIAEGEPAIPRERVKADMGLA